ncbi:MAG: hypothetical protein J6Y02_02720 [Pseudobutyrivibrio sp.]|nr:hypothetical protein [Pseudobutyrivibrio sp.]
MPTNTINDTGLKYVYDKLNGKKLEESTLASSQETETTMTATKEHAANSKFYLAATQQYCMATDDIAIGDTLEENTNYVAITINGFLTDMEAYLILAGQMLDAKADKVSGATNGNLAGLNGSGNLTDSGWNGAKDTTSISGNPISISGLKANQLAKDPIITLEPIQAGSGTPSPVNQRPISGYDKVEALSGGVNIFDEQLEIGTYDTETGEKSSAISNCLRSKNKYRIMPNAWYNLVFPGLSSSRYVRFFAYDEGLNYLGTFNVTQAQFRVTISNAAYIAFRLDTQYGTTYNNNISVNYPATITTYVPYNKATSISESLGQTVYGLTHEVRTGKAKVTCKAVDMGTLNYIYNSTLAAEGIFPFDISDMSPNAQILVCSGYEAIKNNNGWAIQNNQVVHPNTFQTCRVKNTNCTTVEQIKAANSGIILVYELATPIEIQLTPHEISLLKDYAYVSTNGTSIALDYHNGELASLSDVAQVGKTVNLISGRFQAPDYPKAEFAYNASLEVSNAQTYTCPQNGYIFVQEAYGVVASATNCPYFQIKVGNVTIFRTQAFTATNNRCDGFCFPVSKDDIVTFLVVTQKLNNLVAIFVPCKNI